MIQPSDGHALGGKIEARQRRHNSQNHAAMTFASVSLFSRKFHPGIAREGTPGDGRGAQLRNFSLIRAAFSGWHSCDLAWRNWKCYKLYADWTKLNQRTTDGANPISNRSSESGRKWQKATKVEFTESTVDQRIRTLPPSIDATMQDESMRARRNL